MTGPTGSQQAADNQAGTFRYLTHDGVDGAGGLALDEALMVNYRRSAPAETPPTLRLYTYADHTALCGRYQNLEAEIDQAACELTSTSYNRRPTGGGAIVMGSGQLGVALVTKAPTADHPKAMLERFSAGIVAGLAELGIEATFAGKNDLKVQGRKIAGLGLYLDGQGGLLFHSSVLADLDIPFMLHVLQTPASKLGAAGVTAVAERITTVTDQTGRPWTGAELREVMARGFANELGVELVASSVTDEELARTDRLLADKYHTDDWRLQRSPRSDRTGSSAFRTPAGFVRVYVSMMGDTIKSAMFTGDFNQLPAALADFEASLKWARASHDDLAAVASATCGDDCGLGVPIEAVITAVLAAADQVAQRAVAAPEREGSCYFPEPASLKGATS